MSTCYRLYVHLLFSMNPGISTGWSWSLFATRARAREARSLGSAF